MVFYREIKLTKVASTLKSAGGSNSGGSNTVELRSSSKRVLSSGLTEQGAQRQSIGCPVWTVTRYSCCVMPVWHVRCCHCWQSSHCKPSWRARTGNVQKIQRSIVYVIESSRFVMIVAIKADKLKWHAFPRFIHTDGSESSCHLFIGSFKTIQRRDERVYFSLIF